MAYINDQKIFIENFKSIALRFTFRFNFFVRLKKVAQLTEDTKWKLTFELALMEVIKLIIEQAVSVHKLKNIEISFI